MHLEKITIENFRGITQSSTVSGFNKMTILVGPNNSGKSTLLESIFLGTCEGVAGNFYKILGFVVYRRGDFGNATISKTFNEEKPVLFNFELSNENFVKIKLTNQKNSVLINYSTNIVSKRDKPSQWEVNYNELLNSKIFLKFLGKVQFIDTKAVMQNKQLEDIYRDFESQNKTQAFVKMLSENSQALSKLTDFRLSLEEDGTTVLFASFDREPPNHRHPAYFLGDGAKKLMQVFGTIANCKDGICLLEEPEAFQHPKYSNLLVKIFEDAIYKNNTQIILCTHSLEFVDSILENFNELGEDKLNDVSILQTELVEGKL
ncbi:AAA family ATPase, partial [bacterium]|nr:AAA family ATPase [bacterium]